MRKRITISIVSLIILSIGIFSPSITAASVEDNSIPEWLKTTAKWWAEGKVGDSDFVGGLQWLVDNDMLTISHNEQTAKQEKDLVVPGKFSLKYDDTWERQVLFVDKWKMPTYKLIKTETLDKPVRGIFQVRLDSIGNLNQTEYLEMVKFNGHQFYDDDPLYTIVSEGEITLNGLEGYFFETEYGQVIKTKSTEIAITTETQGYLILWESRMEDYAEYGDSFEKVLSSFKLL